MIQKRLYSLRTKVSWNFYDMIKILLIIKNNVIILPYMNIYSKLHENFADNLPKQN